MKVTVNVDCTPEEARVFFGLPDVKPLQQAMMAEMEKRMKTGLTAQDMESLMKAWMPHGLGGGSVGGLGNSVEQFQKMFWNTFTDPSTNPGTKQGTNNPGTKQGTNNPGTNPGKTKKSGEET